MISFEKAARIPLLVLLLVGASGCGDPTANTTPAGESHTWCIVRTGNCLEYEEQSRQVVNEEGEVKEFTVEVCVDESTPLLGCDAEATGCKVCSDPYEYGTDVSPLDICRQWCRDGELAGNCHDFVWIANDNVLFQNAVAETTACQE